MNKEVPIAIGIIVFSVLVLLLVMPLNFYSTDFTIPSVVVGLSFIGTGAAGWASAEAVHRGPKKFASLFAVCATLLFVLGIFLIFDIFV